MRIRRLAQAGENAFRNVVALSVYGLEAAKPGMIADEANWKVDVQFGIDVEYRDWGIKGISLTPHGVVELAIPMSSEQDESVREDVMLRFEPGKLKVERAPSDAVTVGDIDLWVNPDLTPDYGRSTITVYGPTRD